MGFFARISGLAGLAERYPVTVPPQGSPWYKQTVQIGAVRYRRCVTVQAGDAGLTLSVRPPLGRHVAIQVPWGDLAPLKQTRIYWARAMQLSVGRPQVATIAVQMGLYNRFRLYLNGPGT